MTRPLRRPAVVRELEIRFETGPGVQTQADWAELGLFPVGDQMVELSAMVAILGCSRAPAIRFATDRTRSTSLERLAWCLHDLGGATCEVLTDRDVAFCVGQTSAGAAILAPEWVDLAELLGMVPRACRPYRAKTKGKVVSIMLAQRRGWSDSGQGMTAVSFVRFVDQFWSCATACTGRAALT